MISALECFHFAILELVRSTPIKQRLICVYRRHLCTLREDQLPGEAREPFRQVMRTCKAFSLSAARMQWLHRCARCRTAKPMNAHL